MKIHKAKSRAFLKTVSFILAMLITLNVVSVPTFSAVRAESADTSYDEINENISEILSLLPDSAELENMYISRLFYGEGISLYRDYGRTMLDGVKLEIYEALRKEIEKTAAGENIETVFAVNISEPYNDTDTLYTDLRGIIRCLLVDLPEDFYWYDKTEGYTIRLSGYTDGKQTYYTKIILGFTVSDDYADKSAVTEGEDCFTIDPSKINSAKKAAENARKIAEEYSGLSYYNKILKYKDKICELNEYNYNAADNDDTPYGDPWQLVYVFDGDPDTNVVCEGYSKAFQYLCDLGGIECYTITGNLSAGTGAGGHMWNIVVLNGKSYLVDVTNCDGNSIGSPDKLLLKGADESDSNGCKFIFGKTTISYEYIEFTLSLYTEDILTVSTEDFDPNTHFDHTVCGDTDNCPEHEPLTWTAWDSNTELPSSAGNYYLTADVTLTESWKPADGTRLCLNGHTIAPDKTEENEYEALSDGVIYIDADYTFELCDCTGGGKIGENTAAADSRGGGISNSGTFNMYGGQISGNASTCGGGVHNNGTFNMYGGEISDNAAESGGGIYNDKTFKMLGGKIIGNTTGVGVGSNSSELIIGGEAVIKDNDFNGTPVNLLLPSNTAVTSDTDKPLFGDAYIGITTEDNPKKGEPVSITGVNPDDYSAFFYSDNPEYEIINTENNVVQLSVYLPHVHEICEGADNCPDDIHDDIHREQEWTAWKSRTSLPPSAGNYYLTANVTLTAPWIPVDGTSLCLNGHTISAENINLGIIFISGTVIFNLCDCTGGGEISGNNTASSWCGGGISNSGTFNMYGGEISGNTSIYGGISNSGAFNMYGGEISGNTSKYGGGISNSGTFNMYGGKISGNTSEYYGGGVYNEGGIFNMSDGEISENTSSDGGGVTNYDGTFDMCGGKIINNTGRGVMLIGNNSGELMTVIGGNAVIKDNGFAGEDLSSILCNLFLSRGAAVTLDTDDPLSEGAYIGVSTEYVPTEKGEYVSITGENEYDYSVFFHSDDDTYEIISGEDNEVLLALRQDHSFEHIEAVKPTCTEPGNKEYYRCEICSKLFADKNGETPISDVELEALGHLYGDWTIAAEPTEEEGSTGEAVRVCERDESHVERVELQTLIGETWAKTEDILSTCETEGKRVYTNEYGTVTVVLKKLSHEYEEDWQNDPNKHWQICEICKTVNPASENPHSWGEEVITVEPTAEYEGEKTFVCTVCGYMKTEKIPKLEAPVTSSDETEPPVTPPSETEPPVTPPSETEPPVTPPSETEPPVTPPSETEPPVTPPSETEPPVTPPGETEPPVTPPDETEPTVTSPSDTSFTSYQGHFVVPETSGTTVTEPTDSDAETADVTQQIDSDAETTAVPVTENTSIPPQTAEAPAETVQDNVSKRVESSDYIVEMPDNILELVNNVLTAQEIMLINNGSTIEILLTIDNIRTVSDADSEAISKVLNGFTIGQYLDINLYGIIDETQHRINDTSAPVTIKINIPEALLKSGREFAVIRVHDGVGEMIKDSDSSADTITFTTDSFSVYVLVYKDKEIDEDKLLNTGVDSCTAVLLAAGAAALSTSMTLTVMGTGIMGMSEERKNKVYNKLIRWGKGGGKARKTIALALIFLLLSYYYTIGVRAQEKCNTNNRLKTG